MSNKALYERAGSTYAALMTGEIRAYWNLLPKRELLRNLASLSLAALSFLKNSSAPRAPLKAFTFPFL
jgi:hypothetical protein